MEQLKESEDYELIPLEDDPDAWGVRFLNGQFVETVVKFGSLGFNEELGQLSFNFTVISSPDSQLTEENEELQEKAGDILQSIIVEGMEKGWVDVEENK